MDAWQQIVNMKNRLNELMSKGIKIEGKEGRWEEVDQVHGLSPGYVAIQVRTLEPSTYAVFRRLLDPKPMPEVVAGSIVREGDDRYLCFVTARIDDKLFVSFWDSGRIDHGMTFVHRVSEVFDRYHNSIWKREE